jgi:hypothetical protein
MTDSEENGVPSQALIILIITRQQVAVQPSKDARCQPQVQRSAENGQGSCITKQEDEPPKRLRGKTTGFGGFCFVCQVKHYSSMFIVTYLTTHVMSHGSNQFNCITLILFFGSLYINLYYTSRRRTTKRKKRNEKYKRDNHVRRWRRWRSRRFAENSCNIVRICQRIEAQDIHLHPTISAVQ